MVIFYFQQIDSQKLLNIYTWNLVLSIILTILSNYTQQQQQKKTDWGSGFFIFKIFQFFFIFSMFIWWKIKPSIENIKFFLLSLIDRKSLIVELENTAWILKQFFDEVKLLDLFFFHTWKTQVYFACKANQLNSVVVGRKFKTLNL